MTAKVSEDMRNLIEKAERHRVMEDRLDALRRLHVSLSGAKLSAEKLGDEDTALRSYALVAYKLASDAYYKAYGELRTFEVDLANLEMKVGYSPAVSYRTLSPDELPKGAA